MSCMYVTMSVILLYNVQLLCNKTSTNSKEVQSEWFFKYKFIISIIKTTKTYKKYKREMEKMQRRQKYWMALHHLYIKYVLRQ